LLFDPMSVDSIATAIERMASDSALRSELRERGFRRAKDFDWDRTARAFRAVYRRAAGVKLGEEDRWLLSWDWMAQPRREVELVK
jgi:glycogen synthase